VEGLDVLPSLLQQGDQEVDRHVDVLSEFFFVHSGNTDGGTHTEDLLQLESNGGLDFLNLIFDLFVFTDGNGEFADLVKGVTHKLGDLLHQGFRSKKDIERLSPLLDELLVLVEFLGTFDIDATNIDLLGLVTMDGSSDKANLSVGGRNVGESDGTVETLILFGIVISQTDLKFNSFSELSCLSASKHIGNSLLELFRADLTMERSRKISLKDYLIKM
jgi:hypothetical protein